MILADALAFANNYDVQSTHTRDCAATSQLAANSSEDHLFETKLSTFLCHRNFENFWYANVCYPNCAISNVLVYNKKKL